MTGCIPTNIVTSTSVWFAYGLKLLLMHYHFIDNSLLYNRGNAVTLNKVYFDFDLAYAVPDGMNLTDDQCHH